MPAQKQSKKSKHLPALKILIADDDPPTRMLLHAAINQWGYEISEASDGEEAWKILQLPDAPRLLILDWIMPKLDGVELCKRIRHEFTNSYNPYIILLTQMKGAENIINGLDAGANEFLSKPFNMAELHSRLSIGSKIVQNEFAIYKITHLAESCIKKITELSKIIGKDEACSKKINEAKNEIKMMLDYCNQFNSDKKE
jgi:DNA-binding response OmpR family regulator